jgi:hypothetical protein
MTYSPNRIIHNGFGNQGGSPIRTPPRLPAQAIDKFQTPVGTLTRTKSAKYMEHSLTHLDAKTTALQSDVKTLQTDLGQRIRQLEQSNTDMPRHNIEPDDIDQIRRKIVDVDLMANSAMMSSTLTPNGPEIFTGCGVDSNLWFDKLKAYFFLKRIPDTQHLDCLKTFLSDSVLYAITDLPREQCGTFEQLKKAIIDLYAVTPGMRISLSAELARRVQLPGESIESYTQDVIKKAKKIDLKNDLIVDQLLKGFNPSIQQFIIMRSPVPKELSALLKVAREAESLVITSVDNTAITRQLTELRSQLQEMNNKMATPVVQTISTPVNTSKGQQPANYNVPLPPLRESGNYQNRAYQGGNQQNESGNYQNRAYQGGNQQNESGNYPNRAYQGGNQQNSGQQTNYRQQSGNSNYNRQQGRYMEGPRQNRDVNGSQACNRCAGRFRHSGQMQCPAARCVCYGCQGQGHILKACRSNSRPQ